MSVTKLKCECGQAVSDGSVFCSNCKGEVQKKNAGVIKREEKRHRVKMKVVGKKGKRRR
jgi:hypothetical protein